MARKRRCERCGIDISYRPANHYLCYECWKKRHPTVSKSSSHSLDEMHTPMITGQNETYEERYHGNRDFDMGPHWDYDEFPPENL